MRISILFSPLAATAIFLALPTAAQELSSKPELPTKEQLAKDNNLFLSLARKALKWDVPAEPVHIAGLA